LKTQIAAKRVVGTLRYAPSPLAKPIGKHRPKKRAFRKRTYVSALSNHSARGNRTLFYHL